MPFFNFSLILPYISIYISVAGVNAPVPFPPPFVNVLLHLQTPPRPNALLRCRSKPRRR